MKMVKLLLSTSLLGLVACGGSDGGAPAAGGKKIGSHNTGVSAATLEANYRNLRARPNIYSDLDQLPEPAVLLQFSVYDKEAKKLNMHQCSSSLIAPDTILTNSHCIPDSIKYAGNAKKRFKGAKVRKNFNCKKWIVAHVPDNNDVRPGLGKNKFGSTPYDCEKVIFTSANDAESIPNGFQYNQDYAVIKLSEPVPNREFLKVAYDGIEADQKLYTYSFNPPQPGGFTQNEFIRKECKAIEKSELLAKSEYPIGPSILMADCHVVKGNSGSAVVDENNILRGALWGGPGDPAGLQQQYQPRPDMAEFTFVTSASCMNVPGYIEAPDHINCHRPVNPLTTRGPFDVFKEKYEGSVVETASTFPAAAFFEYEVTDERRLRHQAFLGHPTCIKDLDKFVEFLGQPNTMSGEFSLTKYSVDKFHNRYLQFDYELNPASVLEGIFYEVTPPFGADADPVYKFQIKDTNNPNGDPLFQYFLEPCA